MKIPSNRIALICTFLAAAGSPHSVSIIVRCFLVGFSVALCFCVFIYDRSIRRFCSVDQVKRIDRSNFLALFLVVIPIAIRCTPGTWTNLVFDSIAYAGCVCFMAFVAAARIEPLTQLIPVSFPRLVTWLFPLMLVAYFFVVGTQLASSYYAYSTEWIDFSYEFAPVWQNFRYGLFRMINEFSQETSVLRYHWPLLYVFLSPLTLVFKTPVSVLWISTFFFAASAYTVYLLAHFYMQSKSKAALIGCTYLVYVPLHLANLYDFHADPLAMPFVFLSFLFAARKQWPAYWSAVVFALLCKEYVGLLYLGFGIWLAFKDKKNGILTSCIGLFWFIAIVKVGIPHFNDGIQPIVIMSNYGDMGGNNGMAGMFTYAIMHPLVIAGKLFRQNNIVAMLSMLLPFLFFPLSRPWVLSGGIFILIKNALSGSGIELLVHHETLYFPFIVYAFILCISSEKYSSWRFRMIAVIIAVVITFLLQGHVFPARGFWLLRTVYTRSSHDMICDKILKEIAPDASVMSSSHIAPHLMARQWYFLFPRFPTPIKPEYIVVDTLEQADWNWLALEEHRKGFRSLEKSKDYDLIDHDDGIFLFKIRP